MSTVRTLSSFNARLLRQAAPRAFRTNNFSTSIARMTAISDAIKQDHRELEEYYNNILNAKDHDQQTRWQNQFVWELARHSLAEELVVYPAMEKHVKGGKEMADKDRAEHQVVRVNLIVNLTLSLNPCLTLRTGQEQAQRIPTNVRLRQQLHPQDQVPVGRPRAAHQGRGVTRLTLARQRPRHRGLAEHGRVLREDQEVRPDQKPP